MPIRAPHVRAPFVWLLAALVAAAALLVWRARPRDSFEAGRSSSTSQRLTVRLPASTTVFLGRGPALALSPDGRQLAYAAESNRVVRVYLHRVGRPDSTPVPGTEGGSEPFFSPDGRALGFFADTSLKRIATEGGVATPLSDAPAPRGAAWVEPETILVAPRDNTGLWRLPATGGAIQPLTTAAGGMSHRWPQLLPGRAAILHTNWRGGEFDLSQLAIAPLTGGASRVILERSGFGRFVGDGAGGPNYLVFSTAGGLEAVPFDLERLEIVGPAFALTERIVSNRSGGVQMAVSTNGSVAFVPEAGDPVERELVWVDRQGGSQLAGIIRSTSITYDLSTDGARVVRYKGEAGHSAVWIEDLASRTSTRLSGHNDPLSSAVPPRTERLNAVWSPNGTHVVYAAGSPISNLFLAPASAGPGERLAQSSHAQWPTSWSRDGRTVAFVESDPVTGTDIWLLTLDSEWKPQSVRPQVQTRFSESAAVISPDGRWLAYHSNESGRYEVYVQPLPEGGRRWQVSVDGGVYPRWSPRGNELFFRTGPTNAGLSAASVRARPDFDSSIPRELFDARSYETPFAVAPDAARFLMLRLPATNPATEITVIINWLSDLRRHVQ